MRNREILLLLGCLLAAGCKPDPVPIAVDRLVIDTFSPNNSATNDTFLTLIDADGTVLATDDDSSPQGGGSWGFSRIDYTAGLPAGTYYITANKDSTNGGIYYAIRVLDYVNDIFPVPGLLGVDDEPPYDDAVTGGVPTDPVPITLGDGGVQSRQLNPEATDVDWFELIIP